jgi:hypothetical protein
VPRGRPPRGFPACLLRGFHSGTMGSCGHDATSLVHAPITGDGDPLFLTGTRRASPHCLSLPLACVRGARASPRWRPSCRGQRSIPSE